MKEYCKRCSLPLREWEWAGEGWCEVCDEHETRKGETMTYQLKSTCDDAGNLLASGPRTISEHATREQAEAERQDWLRWYADRGVPIGAGCLSVEGVDGVDQ